MKRVVRRALAAVLGRTTANPLFDAEWYLARYADVRLAGYEPWEHYRRHGVPEGRDPNPLFRTGWYIEHNPEVAAAGWNPLDHYLARGAAAGRDPSPAFDTDWYLEQNPDVGQAGLNPLLHYLRQGQQEGRAPRPIDLLQAVGASPEPSPVRRANRVKPSPGRARASAGIPRTIVFVDQHVPEHDRSAGGRAIWQYVSLLSEDLPVAFIAHDGELADPYATDLGELGVELIAGLEQAGSWFAEHGPRVGWVITARPAVAPAYISLVRSTTSARLLYFTHDLHYVREMRRAQLEGRTAPPRHALRLRDDELRIIRSVDAVLTASTAEANLLAQLVPRATVHVIPLLMFDRDDLPNPAAIDLEGRSALIFVGGYRHEPNVDAARYLVDEIMPIVWQARPQQRLIIAGSDPPAEVLALTGPNVEVTGYVADLASYYARSRVSVNPLRYGAGVKGKIIESLAACVPVVTTPIGNEGIDLVDGSEALIGGDAKQLARATLAVLEDDRLARQLALAGRQVIEQRFTPAAARRALSAVLDVSLPVPA